MSALPPFILFGCLLLAIPAPAQTTLRLGPSVGGVLSTASLELGSHYSSTSHLGFEAGLLASLQRGHLALQPALRYAQRGFGRQSIYLSAGQAEFRLAYLTLPVQIAYTQHADGRGFQVFAGPYLNWLLSGYYTTTSGLLQRQQSGDVVGADERTVELSTQPPDTNFYAHRLDLGAQAGAGYRWGNMLVQASYSLGLRNIATTVNYTRGGMPAGSSSDTYYSRAGQLSVSYLF